MKKSLISFVIVTGLVTAPAGMSLGFAATTVSSAPIATSAEVSGSMAITVTLKKNDWNGADLTSINFGTLQPFENPVTHGKTLRSSTAGSTGTGAVLAWLSANSHGLPYLIRQTGTALSNGATTLPSGACCVTPVYVDADNGAPIPAGAAIGTAGTWVATDKLIYQSELGVATMKTVRAYYSITDDPAAGATDAVGLGQPTGIYNGTVTFTVTA